MKNEFDIQKLLKKGSIDSALEYERALIASRKLRILAKENNRAKLQREELLPLITTYEAKEWSPAAVQAKNEEDWQATDQAEHLAEQERRFLQERKSLIRERLKAYGLRQNDLMLILGHKSKSYMSELINGLVPFTLQDLVVIHKVLKIDLVHLVPTFLSPKQRLRLGKALQEISPSKAQLDPEFE